MARKPAKPQAEGGATPEEAAKNAKAAHKKRISDHLARFSHLPEGVQKLVADVVGAHDTIVAPGDDTPSVNVLPTGTFMLDLALHGGIPDGFITMIYGYESGGKSHLVAKCIVAAQRKYPHMICVMVDAEGHYDAVWFRHLGVDTSRLVVVRPEHGQQAVDVCEAFTESPDVSLVALDSIPACVPQDIIARSAEDKTMGQLAALMGVLCSKLTVSRSKRLRLTGFRPTNLLVNQFREKVGFVMGNPETLPGGKQINNLATLKLKLRAMKTHVRKEAGGIEIPELREHEFTVEKTKLSQPYTKGGAYQMILDHAYGVQGSIDNLPTVCTMAKEHGFITGAGSAWRLLTMENEEGGDQPPRFGSLTQIENFLHENGFELDRLQSSIIASTRHASNLPPLPPDGILSLTGTRLAFPPDHPLRHLQTPRYREPGAVRVRPPRQRP